MGQRTVILQQIAGEIWKTQPVVDPKRGFIPKIGEPRRKPLQNFQNWFLNIFQLQSFTVLFVLTRSILLFNSLVDFIMVYFRKKKQKTRVFLAS